MKHQLITLNPITRITRPVGGYLPQRTVAEGQVITAPVGHAYVPISDRPEYDTATQRIQRLTTLEGDGWEVVDFTDEELAARNAIVIPDQVSRRQLFLVLASLPSPVTRAMIRQLLGDNELALIEFEEALSFERQHPLISQLAGALGMTSDGVDQLFIAASNL